MLVCASPDSNPGHPPGLTLWPRAPCPRGPPAALTTFCLIYPLCPH
jgi:hypothetical protein